MKTVITGMGRSGTKWLSIFLGVPHEPRSDDGSLFLDAWNGHDVSNRVERIINCMSDDWIEVNSNMRSVIYDLLNNDVRVIFITKDPYYLIPSLHNCGVFEDNQYHLKPNENMIIYKKWNKMTRVEKLCWYYSFTYSTFFSLCGESNNAYIFKFEDLISSKEYMKKFCSLLGLDFFDDRWEYFVSEKINSTPVDKKLFRWDSDSLNVLNKSCSNVMRICGYPIRECVNE